MFDLFFVLRLDQLDMITHPQVACQSTVCAPWSATLLPPGPVLLTRPILFPFLAHRRVVKRLPVYAPSLLKDAWTHAQLTKVKSPRRRQSIMTAQSCERA